MEENPVRNLITKESLQGTIERDPTSCFWFSRALLIPRLDNHFKLQDAPIKARKSLRQIIFTQKIIYFLCIPISLCLFLVFHNPLFLWGNIAAFVFLYLLERLKITMVTPAAWWWVNNELSKDELSILTYFQLTERLGKKYGIPTLVDTITRWDWTLRKWLLAFYVLFSFILFLNLMQFSAILIIAFCLTALFLRYASY